MWMPSFYAVLHDLWLFLWRIDTTSRTTTQVSKPIQKTVRAQTKPTLITVDQGVSRPMLLTATTIYTSETPATIIIRQTLNTYDSHVVQEGNLTLAEWLLYKIHTIDDAIALLALAMTPIGRWHQTLKAQSGVRVSIEPTTGALIEWSTTAAIGQAGFITQVSPDQTITLQTISQEPAGMCQEQILVLAQWKELGPVFSRFRA